MSWATGFRLRQYIKASLWIVPLGGIIFGTVFAHFAVQVDGAGRLPADWRYSASTASSVLSSIVGSMIALLGFVVTIGVLVVQQATGTPSPRYMRLWYRDRLQKAVLATFTGTFAFAFSLLRSIESDSVPDLGVTLAGLAVAVSLLLLLVHLNRFTHNLRPVAIADLVVRRGQCVPARWAAESARHGDREGDGGTVPMSGAETTVIRSERGGRHPGVPRGGSAGCRGSPPLHARTHPPVGDFVVPGTPLIEVRGGVSAPDPRQLQGYIALGPERTVDQDPAFALRILVDIAIRALSPAVNDPTTAVQVLNHIDVFLHAVGRSALRRSHVVAGERGRPLVIVPGRTWENYLQLAVTEIREYGATSTQACRRLRALLEGLLDTLPASHHDAVRAELTLLDASVRRHFADPAGRATAGTGDRQGIGGGCEPAGPTSA
ncbi:DUF2254 domain-containing protein [Streptomyces sp. NPDC096176]|uniref:DUF2254 domain-containing protein n=1 Tax=Streptomyces sp. NPDC096176 TaxID=3366079 RepID=UPI003801EAF4